MRHLAKFIITLTLFGFIHCSSFSAIKGGVDYGIPIDYTKLNKEELELKAENYYNAAINSKGINENMTSALVLYTILTNKEPENTIYLIRLGKLYDVISKDKYAKGNYYRAMGLNQKRPEPYFYLGEYYYHREQYRKALKFYKRAYEAGYSKHYHTLYNIGNLYQKFGDTQSALKYFQEAAKIETNDELNQKIHQIETLNTINKEYYKK